MRTIRGVAKFVGGHALKGGVGSSLFVRVVERVQILAGIPLLKEGIAAGCGRRFSCYSLR